MSLLLRTTTLHPHIPLFPSASWASRTSNASIQAYMPASLPSLTTVPILEKKANIRTQQSSQLKTPSAPSSRAESASSTSINLIRKVPPTHTPPVLPPYLTSLMMPSTPSTVLSPAVATPSPTVPHVPPTPVTHLGLRQSPLSQHTNGHVNGPITSKTPAPPSRESTPLSSVYPKAGQGLMSKLPVDDEDGEWMVDTDDYMAFSHLVYGAAGDKLEENGVALA